MTDATTGESGPIQRKRNPFRPEDFAWLLFVAVLFATAPERNYNSYIVLPLIGAFQIAEPRMKVFSSRKGRIISITLKMVLSYLLVGWTHSIDSTYYPIFLIPVVSAATQFELGGVIAVTLIACVAYLSFLLLAQVFVRFTAIEFQGYLGLMSSRTAFFAIVASLVYEQAKAKRDEMQRTKEAAERLAESNRNLREAQASLRRSERLAALGQMTAGLAHELRNPLGTIKASAEMLAKPSVKNRPDVMDEMAEYIGSEVDRMNGLVASFLDFARPLQIHALEADLRGVFVDVFREQAGLAGEVGVSLVMKMKDEPFLFEFDRDLLRLALSNLVQNAIQASACGQEVELRADAKDENVLIFVSDHGGGIQPQQLESIFNPFFTTKPKGVGLGLAIVAKIIDEHGGRVNVFSEPGTGTRFEVTLPKRQGS